jgi:formylglycine-generating enzyme required for sulfatase activity
MLSAGRCPGLPVVAERRPFVVCLPLVVNQDEVPQGLAAEVDAGRRTVEGAVWGSGTAPEAAAGSVFTTTTDVSGMYTITGLLAGTYIIRCGFLSMLYAPASRVIIVPPGGAEQDFTREMVYVWEGECGMGYHPDHNGGHECWADELPLHRVYLDAYGIDQTPVTNAAYAQCMAAGAC